MPGLNHSCYALNYEGVKLNGWREIGCEWGQSMWEWVECVGVGGVCEWWLEHVRGVEHVTIVRVFGGGWSMWQQLEHLGVGGACGGWLERVGEEGEEGIVGGVMQRQNGVCSWQQEWPVFQYLVILSIVHRFIWFCIVSLR